MNIATEETTVTPPTPSYLNARINEEERNIEEPEVKKYKISPERVIIRAVMGNEFTEPIPLTKVFVTRIVDAHEAKNLSVKLPRLPPHLAHLKRISSTNGVLRILIGGMNPAEANQDVSIHKGLILNELKNKGMDHYKGLDVDDKSVEVLEVSGKCPLSRAQFLAVSSLWPIHFRPDQRIEKLMRPNCGFNEGEIEIIQRSTARLLEKSRSSDGVPACLVQDLSGRVLISTTGLSANFLPLRHAVQVAIDSSAQLQGGSEVKVTEIHKYHIPRENKVSANDSWMRDRNEYLWTGLDVYLSHEPCLMCTMALLHTRAKRVYFVHHSERTGALESISKFHTLSNINHRFEVFHIQLRNEPL